jgi:transposase
VISPAPLPTRFIGCDVGKATVVVFDSHTGRTRTVPNERDALSELMAAFDPTCLVVCESTNGYEAPLLRAALNAGCPAHRACARKVKAFIRSFGTLGKTDAIDAHALARRDLVAQRQACKNRLEAPGREPVASYLQPIVDCFDIQIKALDRNIAALIGSQATLAKAEAALRAIPGIGPKTAAALIALMPELGRLNRRQAAALAGLAPHPRQSGTADRYRPVRGGRPEVKHLLFMAALVAAKRNPTLSIFYERLKQAGKKPIVALTAVMRKLIIIANATLRDVQKNLDAVS